MQRFSFLKNLVTRRPVNIQSFAFYNCWHCNHKLNEQERRKFFCPCESKIILPVEPNTNYFDMFDLTQEFMVDKDLLRKNFRQLMRKLHPDLYAQKSEVIKL